MIREADAAHVRDLLGGFWKTEVVSAAASLGLADVMGDEAWGAGPLATRIGADAGSLYRLLRAMTALGLATHEPDELFALTGAGRALASGVEGSLRGMALHVGTLLAPAFCKLGDSVRTGAPPPFVKHGPDGFAELNDDPKAAHVFNQAMVDGSRRIAAMAAGAYDFARFGTVMDVGGGYGAVLATLLRHAPALTGSVLDLEHAKAGADALFAEEGVADRARFIAASFFDPIPAEADCYLLKYIIHDWADDYAERIMARVAAAAKASGGTVLLIERIVPDRIVAEPAHAGAIQGDLTMMLWGGKERTETEYHALFDTAGLVLTAIVPIGEGFSLIEGRAKAG
jgi:hypothetical protein